MKLSEFIKELTTLAQEGHGEKEVFYRHGASGDCGGLSTAWVTSEVSESGPFNLEDGAEYISIYAGN